MRRETFVTRKATSVTIDAELLAAAKELGINVSRASEEGLAAQVKRIREERWREENAEALQGYNAWVEKNGLPLARYRQF